MTRTILMSGVVLAALGLSACGTTPTERGLTGAGIGAATGGIIGSFSGDAGAGAVIGGVLGGVVGAATSPDDIYLGEPVWRRDCLERQRRGEDVDCRRPPRR